MVQLAETVECVPWDLDVTVDGRDWSLASDGSVALPLLDSIIAATALEHDPTVVARNVDDFRSAGGRVLDPFR